MKITKIVTILLVTVITVSCSSAKKNLDDSLYETTWELDHISGAEVPFNELYPNKKPRITFNKQSNKVKGTSSCNGYSAEFTLNNNTISFGEPGPTTKMYCGEGEQVFLKALQKVNTYEIDSDGNLNLMMDDVSVLRFEKTNAK